MEGDFPSQLLKIPRYIVIILLTSIELSSDLLNRVYNLICNHCKEIKMLKFYSLILWGKNAKLLDNN